MFRPDAEKLRRIRELRARNHTITQIAAETGYPRSTVGHYVKKYCGGRTRNGRDALRWLVVQTEAPGAEALWPKEDRVEAYMEEIRKKEARTVAEILEGRPAKDDTDMRRNEVLILDIFEKRPQVLESRLNVIEQLIRLAPFLKIDPNEMRRWLHLHLTR